MEKKTFIVPAVAGVLNQMVEARLHDDSSNGERNDRIKALKERFAKTVANPTYVLLDPETERVIAFRSGAEMDADKFAAWLRKGLK